MALPAEVRVKLSTEAAGALSVTPVVAQDMTIRALVEVLLGAVGEDPARIADLLKRGMAVSGATRFRWEPLLVETGELAVLLEDFPKSDPTRRFSWDACTRVVIYAGVTGVTITTEEGRRRRWLWRRSFWEAAAEIRVEPRYVRYDHRSRADQFESVLTAEAAAQLREATALLPRGPLAQRLAEMRVDRVELFTKRLEPLVAGAQL